jgi:hypothetical protein
MSRAVERVGMPRTLFLVGLLALSMACDPSAPLPPLTGSALVRADLIDSRVVDAEVNIDVRLRVENRD